MAEVMDRSLRGCRVSIREALPGAIEEAVAHGEVDLGITYVPIPREAVEYLRVTTLEMGIFGRREMFAETRAEDLPFCAPAIPIRGSISPFRGLDGWPEERCARTIVYAADMMQTGLDLARRGVAVVFIPTFVAALHNRTAQARYALERLKKPKGLDARSRRRDVTLVKRRSPEEDSSFKKIAAALRNVCRATE